MLLAANEPRAVLALSKPWTDWSFYVQSSSTTEAYNLGHGQGAFDTSHGNISSEVVLDFGAQEFFNGVEGTKTVPPQSAFMSYAQIESYVEQFATGYWAGKGSGNTSSVLRLGVGTSNFWIGRVDYGGGQSWAGVVNFLRTWMTQSGHMYSSQITVWGASDVEPSFWSASGTKNWVSGYDVSTIALLINYGSADGCPSDRVDNAFTCTLPDWHQDDLWWISWGTPAGEALPEIYYDVPTKVNAWEWQKISLEGAQAHGQKIGFQGSLENHFCDPSTNTDQQAWDQLQGNINSNASTAWPMSYSAEIHVSNSNPCPP